MSNTTQRSMKNGFSLNTTSLGHLQARARPSEKRFAEDVRHFRVARLKPGFVIGTLEHTPYLYNSGDYIAEIPCRLHWLTQSRLRDLEGDNPELALELFKMMSYLNLRLISSTIDQLATLHQIMSASAPTQPVSRGVAAGINSSYKTMTGHLC